MKTLVKLIVLALVALPNLSWASPKAFESKIQKQLLWLNNEIENHDHQDETMELVFNFIQKSLDRLESGVAYDKPKEILDMDLYVMNDDVYAAFAGLKLDNKIAMDVFRNLWLARQQLKANRLELFDTPYISEDPILTADLVDNQLWSLEDLMGRAPAQTINQ